jgi:hypothetical protein
VESHSISRHAHDLNMQTNLISRDIHQLNRTSTNATIANVKVARATSWTTQINVVVRSYKTTLTETSLTVIDDLDYHPTCPCPTVFRLRTSDFLIRANTANFRHRSFHRLLHIACINTRGSFSRSHQESSFVNLRSGKKNGRGELRRRHRNAMKATP